MPRRARISAGIAVLRLILPLAAFLSTPRPAQGDYACALLLGGFRDDCVIISAGNKSMKPKAMMFLYSGDRIVQQSGADEIVIKCSPFTSVKRLNESTLQIVHQPPSEKKSVIKELQTFLGFEKDVHQRITAGTRALFGEGSDVLFPQPGYWATVMPRDPIVFSWDRKGDKTIVFRDSSGEEVFSKAIGEKTSIELTSQEIKMRPSEIYYWEIEIKGVPRSSETYSLKLLEDDMVDLIASELDKLAEEKTSETEKKLSVAAFCQLISDTYPDDVDLYWKSHQILKELNRAALSAEQRNVGQMLRDRCIQHIQEQMAAGRK